VVAHRREVSLPAARDVTHPDMIVVAAHRQQVFSESVPEPAYRRV
jgi:hypothetical protein